MNDKIDVLIVGAGPAGSAAAITLAGSDLEIAWIDKASFPRDKTCGDGLTTGALRHLEALGVDVMALRSFQPSRDLVVRSPSGRFATLPLADRDGVFAGAARRVELDRALVERASSLGAKLVEGESVIEVRPVEGGLEVGLASGRLLHPRFVIAADGAWSSLRRLVAPTPRRLDDRHEDWHAFRTYVTTQRSEALEHLHVWFEDDELPGYRWSFPVAENVVNAGICLAKAPGSSLNASANDLLNSSYLTSLVGPDATLETPLRSWPIPTGVHPDTLCAAKGRVLFVGDAARAGDPFTGEGIAQALSTGCLAGSCIRDQANDAPGTLYRQIVLRGLARGQALSRLCRVAASRPIGTRGAVRLLSQSEPFAKVVGRWLYDDVPKELILAPRTWSAGWRRARAPFSESQPAPRVR